MMGYFGETNLGKNLFQDMASTTSICPHCKQSGQLEKIPGIDLLYYPSKLREGAFDIAVAPIIETGFNQGKSDLKIKEYAALGIPVVASNITPYKESVKNGYTGFLASTGKEWFDSLELLIKDEVLRKRLGKNNHLWYSQNTIDKHIHEWIQFYQRLVSFKSKW
jgi:glycosyltransferase involved in cell wall biosynthesis